MSVLGRGGGCYANIKRHRSTVLPKGGNFDAEPLERLKALCNPLASLPFRTGQRKHEDILAAWEQELQCPKRQPGVPLEPCNIPEEEEDGKQPGLRSAGV